MADLQQRHLMGLLVVGLSALVTFFACSEHKMSTNQKWLLIVVAFIFALAGLQLITAAKGRFSALMAGLVCGGFSGLGFFVAFSRETLQGGIPFIPATWNQNIGHMLFGFGALITAAMAFYFFVRAIKSGKRD